MKYIIHADTDVGIGRFINQDSICMKMAHTASEGFIVMAVVCDGMGGLQQGEVASKKVVSYCSEWFEEKLPHMLRDFSWDRIKEDWIENLKILNYKIQDYGESKDIQLGTTMSAILIVNNRYLIIHIGDTRIYQLDHGITLLTEDHTFIAQQIREGRLSVEEAQQHPKRNVLLRCIGVGDIVKPQILEGTVQAGQVFVLCSDGFRHKITEDEIYDKLSYDKLEDKQQMQKNARVLIELVKERNEKDNISVALIKVCE